MDNMDTFIYMMELQQPSMANVVNIEKSSLNKELKKRFVKRNLILQIFNWVCASFAYYQINFFVKYLPGDIYVNQMVSSISTIGNLIAGPI